MLPCVVLAGGLGTRLRPRTQSVPKVLIPINGRPFAELQIELLRRQGVRQLIYSIGFLGSLVRSTLGDGSRWGMTIEYVDEEDDLRGSGGALRFALGQGKLSEAFFVINGDSYLRLDLADVEAAWRTSGLPALMTVFRNTGRWDRSNVRLHDGRVFYDKHAEGSAAVGLDWIDYGLSILRRETISNWHPDRDRGDLADLMHELSAAGQVAGYLASQRFYEIGSLEGIRNLERHLNRRYPPDGS